MRLERLQGRWIAMRPENIDIVIFAMVMATPMIGIAIAGLIALMLDL